MEQHEVDVLIVGAGPAGAACGISLRNHANKQVLIIDNSDLQQTRVGEHVTASIFEFMDYLNVADINQSSEFITENYGNTSYWGSQSANEHSSLFTAAGNTYQLQRSEFDTSLLYNFVAVGGNVLLDCADINFEQQADNTWVVHLLHSVRGSIQIRANFLVDGSGRNAHISKSLGLSRHKKDDLMGVGCFLNVSGLALTQEQLIETTENGWWYCAALPNEKAVVTFFTDMDIIKELKLNKPDYWNFELAKTKHVKKRISGSQSVSDKLWLRNASSQLSEGTPLKNFVAIGDAAASFDPISSMGLGFAISSACFAAKAIHASIIEKTQKPLLVYQDDVVNNFKQYCQIHKQVYQQETRWNNSDFWQRRSA
ncbi:lysine-epsilon-oxidase maturase LodB [Pseudoalteromonas tunicata]|uniref:FAD-binding domain-containing protein n=1 Tax=Pseudoalteromonas tunicata D2 TaxID=87626 RepID=A4C9W8_9GAMM|nr:lysine-epsilon-oxidase maturase LodB [Pseudoalteromonas tunicata]ATC94724.1 hypothetical protein PTUN_a2206 [Pseudoalteromonas tunicata]AXT30433.1 FAD-dependent oxidoreductase [Pseudoalteromonas tunicata]EAR28176.1 hypothetical protein PTD2_20212 [Pseudoalteromonas tunicata D2]